MIIKKYIPISAGLSFRQNELTRKESMASEMINADYSEHKSLTKRVGLHPIEFGTAFEVLCQLGDSCAVEDKDDAEGIARVAGKWERLLISEDRSAIGVAVSTSPFYTNLKLGSEDPPTVFSDREKLLDVPTNTKVFRGINYLTTEDKQLYRTDKTDIVPVGIEGYSGKETTTTFKVIRGVLETINTRMVEVEGGFISTPPTVSFYADEQKRLVDAYTEDGGRILPETIVNTNKYPTVYFLVAQINKERGTSEEPQIMVGQAIATSEEFRDGIFERGVITGVTRTKLFPNNTTKNNKELRGRIDDDTIDIPYVRDGWDTTIIKAIPNLLGQYSFRVLKSNVADATDTMPVYGLEGFDIETGRRIQKEAIDTDAFVTEGLMSADRQGKLRYRHRGVAMAISGNNADKPNILTYETGNSTPKQFTGNDESPTPTENPAKADLDLASNDLIYLASANGYNPWAVTGRGTTGLNFSTSIELEYLWDLGNTDTTISETSQDFQRIWFALKERYDIDGMLASFKSYETFPESESKTSFGVAVASWNEIVNKTGFHSHREGDTVKTQRVNESAYTLKNIYRNAEGPEKDLKADTLRVVSGDTTHLAFRLRYTDKSLRKNVSYSLPYEESFRHYFGTNTDAKDGFEGQYPGGRTASITLNEIKLSNTEWAKDFLNPIIDRLTNSYSDEEVVKEKLKESVVVEVYQTLPNDQVHFFTGEFPLDIDLDTRDVLGIEATPEDLSKGRDALVAGGDFDYVTALKAVVPPKAGLIEEWRNLLVLSDIENQPNAIRIMDGDNLDGFPFSKELVIDNAFGLPITSIRELNGVLYVFTEGTIHVVSGNPWVEPLVSARGAAVRVDKVLEEGIGCVSQTAITEKDKMLWFVGNTSIYTLGREGVRDMAEELEPLIKGLDKSNVHAFTWKAGERILFNFANDNKTLVYHITVRQWTIWEDVNFDGGIIEKNNKVFLLDKQSGQIRTFADLGTKDAHKDKFKVIGVEPNADAVTTTILGVEETLPNTYPVSLVDDKETNVKFTYKMHWEHMDTPTAFKKLNRLKVYALPSEGDEFNRGFSLKLTIEYDFGNKKVKKVPLSRNIRMAVDDHPAGWGKSAWGGDKTPDDKTDPLDPADEWGGPSHELLVEKTVRLPSRKCRSFRLTLENDSDENILVSGMEISGTQVTQNMLKTGK